MTVAQQVTPKEALEAHVRMLMAKRAALPDTWDHRAERRAMLADINAALETFNTQPEDRCTN